MRLFPSPDHKTHAFGGARRPIAQAFGLGGAAKDHDPRRFSFIEFFRERPPSVERPVLSLVARERVKGQIIVPRPPLRAAPRVQPGQVLAGDVKARRIFFRGGARRCIYSRQFLRSE